MLPTFGLLALLAAAPAGALELDARCQRITPRAAGTVFSQPVDP